MTDMAIKGCVFDLDGTLADTAPDIAAALNAALREVGQPSLPIAEVISMIGGGVPTLVERAIIRLAAPASLADLLVERMLYHYGQNHCVNSRLMVGVEGCLDTLRRRGVLMAVCTNKEQGLARKIVTALGIEPYFVETIGRTPDVPKKPDPSMLEAAMKALGCRPGSVVMVGDSDVDAATATAAGVTSVIVRNGYYAADHNNLGADHLIDDMTGFLQVFDEIQTA